MICKSDYIVLPFEAVDLEMGMFDFLELHPSLDGSQLMLLCGR